jgi:hypothetical protein
MVGKLAVPLFTHAGPAVSTPVGAPCHVSADSRAFDGSVPSTRGLDEPISLASQAGARLRLIHMVNLTFATGFETCETYMKGAT